MFVTLCRIIPARQASATTQTSVATSTTGSGTAITTSRADEARKSALLWRIVCFIAGGNKRCRGIDLSYEESLAIVYIHKRSCKNKRALDIESVAANELLEIHALLFFVD